MVRSLIATHYNTLQNHYIGNEVSHMARPKNASVPSGAAVWLTAIYTRLSREDGDKPDSDSIINQTRMLEDYIRSHSELNHCPVLR